MKPFAVWKYIVLLVALLVGALYALPNVFGEDPALQVSRSDDQRVAEQAQQRVLSLLEEAGLAYSSARMVDGQLMVRMESADQQLAAAEMLRPELGRDFVVALNMATRTPDWLVEIGARPMNLGLDLRGGVHFLLEVDIPEALNRAAERYLTDLPAYLRTENIRYTGRNLEEGVVTLEFADTERRERAMGVLQQEFPELSFSAEDGATPGLTAQLSEEERERIADFAVKQNLTTLRNRVNQLGVSEPLVQRQGEDRIVVQLPGVQDTTRVKDLLGATATLEYRPVDQDGDAERAARTGQVPFGSELFYTREGNRPTLLKRDIIASGNQLVDAQATIDQESGTPAVSVTLDGAGADRMFEFTQQNVGKPMAVLFRETEVITTYNAKGEPIRETNEIEEIISIATIRGVFGKRFQTTGLSSEEARDLALLLRAGALAAPVVIVEERTVGPSLGADNIAQGQLAAVAGLIAVLIFMGIYYKVFGLLANVALVFNLTLIIAAMSMIQATLTMPGIAGIVLTLGMAVDANVLIYERIREEIYRGTQALQAIDSGYERAFLTIADSQVTTLIAAVVLFALGSGPVKGFAVTLSIGIATSMFTAIVATRALVHIVYGRRARMADLPI
ncbi:protein translocase subunit SecD [Algiphilus aromaticivorans]|jgi:preprotein translocase subunit SecD|uniref:protein translocase subunit SecD n=1 Tax=Algiphilus aromaticivorans TaxID=382454 RepID=UPI0005C12FE0|nr:protein translocase subunit SecD [Algiphilus aromaticivorans]